MTRKMGPNLPDNKSFTKSLGVTKDPSHRNDFVWVPTMDFLRCRVIPEDMIVNSSKKVELTSHELYVHVDGTTDVVPKAGKTRQEEEEMLFHYNYSDDETGVCDPL